MSYRDEAHDRGGGHAGKTTTASMIVHALRAAGLDPGWLVGAPVGGGLANAEWGEGEWLVVEADESDRSMLSLRGRDRGAHERRARPPRDLRLAGGAARRRFARSSRAPRRRSSCGTARSCSRCAAAGRPSVEVVPYDVPDAAAERRGLALSVARARGALAVPGAHNALNAAGALEAARLAGADAARAIEGLAGFTGAGRRFQLLGRSRGGALVYDDYAHHPTEVAATLRAARTLAHRRLVAVFQPHLFSRTALLAREFGARAGAAPTWWWCSTSTPRASAPRTTRASAGC